MLCKECNNTGYCVWCEGTGRGRSSSGCDRCRGSGTCFSCGGKKLDAAMVQSMLQDLATGYRDKISENYQIAVQITIMDLEQSWALIVQRGRDMYLQPDGHPQAAYFFSMDAETLRKIYAGEMTAMTAAGKAGSSEVPPLQVSVAKGVDPRKARNQIFAFLQKFFNKTHPEKIVLAEKHARLINGARAIPLYSSAAQRSSWYMLRNGDRLNDGGKSNPFPQSFVFMQGEGYATIGQETVKVKAGESYYVPPKMEHVVWNENKEPLVLISMAWSEKA